MSLATFEAPLVAYAWIGILTFTTYALAGHMREQVCLYMCPWPRIQAALTDEHALNVTYRYDRGEPRGSIKKNALLREQGAPAGDCIDCRQCVNVCPTGVDIRNGAELGLFVCGVDGLIGAARWDAAHPSLFFGTFAMGLAVNLAVLAETESRVLMS